MVCRTLPFRWFTSILAVAVLFGVCAPAGGNPKEARKAPSSEEIDKILKSLETDLLLIQPASASSGGVAFAKGPALTLTPADAQAIIRECRPAVKAVAPVVRTRTRVVYRKKEWVPLFIYGTTPSFLEVRTWGIERGRRFTDRDVRGGARVCLLGRTLVRELFGNESPVGKEVRVQNVSFRVVGVLSPKGANMMGLDQDDILLAPWTTIKYRVAGVSATTTKQGAKKPPTETAPTVKENSLKNLYPQQPTPLYPQPGPNQGAVALSSLEQILVKVVSEKEIPAVTKKITALLRERHHIPRGKPDDFNIRDMSEMARALRRARDRLEDREPRKEESRPQP